jgi:hypothetical protein
MLLLEVKVSFMNYNIKARNLIIHADSVSCMRDGFSYPSSFNSLSSHHQIINIVFPPFQIIGPFGISKCIILLCTKIYTMSKYTIKIMHNL